MLTKMPLVVSFCMTFHALLLLLSPLSLTESLEFNLNTTSAVEILSKVIELTPVQSLVIHAASIPPDAKFLLIAAHHQEDLVTLSYNSTRIPRQKGTYATGRDVGLVVLLEEKNETDARVWLTNNNNQKIKVLLAISWYPSTDPVPGGCNQEFDVEVSPFIRLQEDIIENQLDFQLSRLGSPRGLVRRSCDISRSFIRHEVYAYFLREDDFSQDELFRGIRLMSDPTSARRYGTKVVTYSSRRTRALILSYPGRGVVYNVIAVLDQRAAAYVPVASYNCDLKFGLVGCGKMNEIVAVILLSILSINGLVITFRGHQWFQYQVIWSGYLFSLISLLITFAKYVQLSSIDREIVALIVSFPISIVWLGIWRCFKKPLISVLMSGLLLGFIVIASVLFSTLGNEELFRSELNYWLILGVGSIVVPIVLLPFGSLLSILSCSIVGSYSAVFAVDRFVGGSLSYIVINVLKRAAFKDVLSASNQVPFQGKDIALTATWAGLALFGLVTQLYMSSQDAPRRRTRSESLRLSRRLRRHSTRRRGRSRSSSRSRSRLRRSSRSRVLRPTAPPTEPAEENQPLIAEAAPIVYSAI